MEEDIKEASKTNIEVNEVLEEKPTGEGDVETEDKVENDEDVKNEENLGEEAQKEGLEAEGIEGEGLDEEKAEGEALGEGEEKVADEGIKRDEYGEEMEGEQQEGEEQAEDEKKPEETPAQEEVVEEEEAYVEEPPPDPAAPYDYSDSKEAIKEPFELRPDQLAELEQLWEVYQNYTPAYTDIDNYITEKELVYMLKSLILLPFTPEQLQELIEYCVRPHDPNGHINFDQFVKMVKLRQRDFPIEEELRLSLQVMDPDKTGSIDREFLKETLSVLGHKMPKKQLDNLIKEVDIANDGTIGVEDVVGTMCIDLNKEDLMMLRASLYPPEPVPEEEEI